MEKELIDFKLEVLTKLAVIESKLDGYSETKKIAYLSDSRSKKNTLDIAEIQEKLKWITRLLSGTVITAVITRLNWCNIHINQINKKEEQKNMTEVIMSILGTIITAVCTYIGVLIKNYLNDKVKSDIVQKVVRFVEQTGSELSSTEKYTLAIEKASDWLGAKGINISSAELDILIESAVNNLIKPLKKEELLNGKDK